MIIRASGILPLSSKPLIPGWLEIKNERIKTVQQGEPQTYDIDLEGYLISPGFINCHCHLDYTLLRNRISPPLSFTEWLKKIIQLKVTFSLEDYQHSIAEGFEELVEFGTTSVLNIEVFPELIAQVSSPIRTWWAVEGIDIKSPFEFNEKTEAYSPHAPYTASQKLYRQAKMLAHKKLFTSHFNESWEEGEMFLTQSGPLYDFLKMLGRDMSDCQGEDALSLFLRHDLIPPQALLAHVNFFSETSLEKMRALNLTVVHCPETHAYFNRPPFPYEVLMKAEIPVVMGSDSLASAPTLSLLANLQQFHRTQPHLSPKTLLEMITLQAAKAVRQENLLGCLVPQAWADCVAVPFSLNQDPYETMVNFTKPIPFVMASGKILRFRL